MPEIFTLKDAIKLQSREKFFRVENPKLFYSSLLPQFTLYRVAKFG